MDSLLRCRVRSSLPLGSLVPGADKATLSSDAGASSQSAVSLLTSAVKNAPSGGWVHEVVVTTSKGVVVPHSTNYVGGHGSVGRVRLTL